MTMESDRANLSPEAQQWLAFTDRLAATGLMLHKLAEQSPDPDRGIQVNEFLLLMMSVGAKFWEQFDADYPDWLPLMNGSDRAINPNPDNVYYLSRIRGSGVYRISGHRGTVRQIELQVMHGYMGFRQNAWPTISSLSFDDCRIAEDGTFEIILSAARPEGYQGNWVQLDPAIDDTYALIRQVAWDWTEVDGRFAIQRIDRPIDHRMPRPDTEITSNLMNVARFLEWTGVDMIEALKRHDVEATPVNQLADTNVWRKAGAIARQVYLHGDIRIADDEAMVIEITLDRKPGYWNVQLMDSFYNGLNSMYHQSCLNAHSAAFDSDGKLRLVISAQDPGIANWIDKGHYPRVFGRFRFNGCGVPDVVSQVVPILEVAKYLPADTARVAPEERQKALRARAESAQQRRRW